MRNAACVRRRESRAGAGGLSAGDQSRRQPDRKSEGRGVRSDLGVRAQGTARKRRAHNGHRPGRQADRRRDDQPRSGAVAYLRAIFIVHSRRPRSPAAS